jgi:hypothetical protein
MNYEKIKVYENLDDPDILKEVKEGGVFLIARDERYWKHCIIDRPGQKEFSYFIYGYAYMSPGQGGEVVYRLDYKEGRRLAVNFNLRTRYAKIVHIVRDHVFLNSNTRSRYKNEKFGLWITEGNRYIAEASIEYFEGFTRVLLVSEGVDSTRTITRQASAGTDNVDAEFVTYCPEMAIKRAELKCIIEALGLKDVVEDFYELSSTDKEQNKNKNKEKDKQATDNQIDMIKKLLKQNKKKFLKKHEKLSYDEAVKLIEELDTKNE